MAKNDFSVGSVRRHIFLQAVPLMVAQFIQLLYNVVDRIYIGHLQGSDGLALTGVGIAFPVISLITAFTDLFGVGGAPLFSIARGAGKEERARDILGATAFLLFTCSLVITALCYGFKRPLLYLFGASDRTYTYANAYLSVYLIGTVFFMTGSGINYFIPAQGFPRTGMLTTMLGAVVNIILDPILIFGLHMGVQGAAAATVIAQTVSALWVFHFITGKRAILRLERSRFHFDAALTREITGLGLSGFIMKSTNGLVQAVCNTQLRTFGGDIYISIITIISSVRDLVFLPGMAIMQGSQPVLGFNLGARKYSRIREGIRTATGAAVLYAATAWLLVMLFPSLFIRIFTPDPEIIRIGANAARLYFSAFLFMIGQFSGQSIFVGLGKSREAIFFSLLRKVIIVVPMTLLLPNLFGLGVNGVWLAEPISNVIGGTAVFVTMLRTVYFRLPKTDDTEHTV